MFLVFCSLVVAEEMLFCLFDLLYPIYVKLLKYILELTWKFFLIICLKNCFLVLSGL